MTNAKDGTVALLRWIDFAEGGTTVTLVARGHAWGTVHVQIGEDGPEVGRIELDRSPYWQRFSARCDIPSGRGELCLRFEGAGAFELLEVVLG